MSSYEQQQQQQQEVVQPIVYPSPQIYQPPSLKYSQHDHSNGSFGSVFIVLAVIAVLSAIGCLLGRLCLRRISSGHVAQKHSYKNRSQSSQSPCPSEQTRVHEFARPLDHHQQQPHGDFKFEDSSMRSDRERGDPGEFGNRSTRSDRERGDHVEFGNRSTRSNREQGDHADFGSRSTRSNQEHGDHVEFGNRSTRINSEHGDHVEFGNRSTRINSEHGDHVEFGNRSTRINREPQGDHVKFGNRSTRSNSEHGENQMEFGFDSRRRSSLAPPIIHGSSILYSNENINGPISGSRRHVAFEINGDHRRHVNYHGGPRAS